jgi:uncharacterized membrane protein
VTDAACRWDATIKTDACGEVFPVNKNNMTALEAVLSINPTSKFLVALFSWAAQSFQIFGLPHLFFF